MTQALDLPTECLATGLTSLTSLSSSAPLSPPSSQFDINKFWEDDDVLPFTPVDASSMFDLVDESTDGLASRRPVLQLGPTDPNIEVESATALKELVESKIGAGAQLLSPEGMYLDSAHMDQTPHHGLTPSQLEPRLHATNRNMLLSATLIPGPATPHKVLWLSCSCIAHNPPIILLAKTQLANSRAQAVRSRGWSRRSPQRSVIRTRLR